MDIRRVAKLIRALSFHPSSQVKSTNISKLAPDDDPGKGNFDASLPHHHRHTRQAPATESLPRAFAATGTFEPTFKSTLSIYKVHIQLKTVFKPILILIFKSMFNAKLQRKDQVQGQGQGQYSSSSRSISVVSTSNLPNTTYVPNPKLKPPRQGRPAPNPAYELRRGRTLPAFRLSTSAHSFMEYAIAGLGFDNMTSKPATHLARRDGLGAQY
ncbi:hypothetical protein DFH09DRAFT_1075323 [Mycena vulgaris]|nr:hypothetical protein DFH09DRAFT_1075323 [Mycena vulgaris]